MVRNPRQEAFDRLGGKYDVAVLEPSPPAVHEGPWFADDPTDALTAGSGERALVSPVTTGDLLWDDLTRDDEELAAWCAERWLGAYPVLGAAPPALVETRMALHGLAAHVISPTRQRANGKIGLRYTRGGFGTPFFGNDVQIAVAGDVLTLQLGERSQSGRLTSLEDAAEFIGFDLMRFDVVRGDEALAIDLHASHFLADWFGFAESVLEQLRAEASAEHDPSRVQLWPEHFDMAVELGPAGTRSRATFGCSPGDKLHAEPYVYVIPDDGGPNGEPWTGELWQATSFSGAELPYAELLAAEDQRATALEFLRARLSALHAA